MKLRTLKKRQTRSWVDARKRERRWLSSHHRWYRRPMFYRAKDVVLTLDGVEFKPEDFIVITEGPP